MAALSVVPKNTGSLPEPAEDGVILMDRFLQPIGMDDGAQEILNDIGDGLKTTFQGRLPKSLLDACRTMGLQGNDGLRVHVAGRSHGYMCRIHRIAPSAPFPHETLVMIHITREFSTRRAILTLSQRYRLSPREEEILLSLTEGLASKEIAQKLRISPNTVKTYLRLIMMKMGVTTRSAIMGKLLESDHHDLD